ncbi:MAG: hypothetical protein WCG23_08890, partial [bacterium]
PLNININKYNNNIGVASLTTKQNFNLNNNFSQDSFIKTGKNLSFSGDDKYTGKDIKLYPEFLLSGNHSPDNIFLADKIRDSVNSPEKKIILAGTSKVRTINGRYVELHGNSSSHTIKATYISLFDKSTAKELHAEISAGMYGTGTVDKIIATHVQVQNSIGGHVKEIQARERIFIDENVSVTKAKSPEVEVSGKAKVDEITTNEAIISGSSKVNKVVSNYCVRVRGNASVNEITAVHDVGLSGSSKVGKVKLTGDKAEVHINNAPEFEQIEFTKGNGKVILHKDWRGNYPEIDETKIKGAVIERSGKFVDGHHMAKIENLVEFRRHF